MAIDINTFDISKIIFEKLSQLDFSDDMHNMPK